MMVAGLNSKEPRFRYPRKRGFSWEATMYSYRCSPVPVKANRSLWSLMG